MLRLYWDCSSSLDSKECAYNAGDPSSNPGAWRFPGEGNGNPLQYPCLENYVDTGACGLQSHKELDMTE